MNVKTKSAVLTIATALIVLFCQPGFAAQNEDFKLLASDGSSGGSFGDAVAISGNRALVGTWGSANATGSAYVYHFDGGGWVEEAKLTATDGAALDRFGDSVALFGDFALVGATAGDGPAADSGAVYVFRRNGNGWTEEAKLTASDGATGLRFGQSVSLSGDTALVGMHYDSDAGFLAGAAYVFRRNGTGWTEEAKLTASDGGDYEYFGLSVSLSGDMALVGASRDDDNGAASGSAYAFRGNVAGGWIAEAKLLPSDGETNDELGRSVALSKGLALAGAAGDDDNGSGAGAAYVFELSAPAVLAAPGPGPGHPPAVRAFHGDGTPLGMVDFMAYGTTKYGVNVACGDIDGDGFDELITGAGPGAVFGPHVRAWNFDGGSLVPISGVSFFAYGTQKWGVNVACADIDGDGMDEIITSPGPGPVFGPHIRAWKYDPDNSSVTPMPSVSFMAYGTQLWGARVSGGDIDGDGFDELITTPGPGAVFGSHVRGWNHDGDVLENISSLNFFAFDTSLLFGADTAVARLE